MDKGVHTALFGMYKQLMRCFNVMGVVLKSWECRACSAHTMQAFVCRQLLETLFWPSFTILLFHNRLFYGHQPPRI